VSNRQNTTVAAQDDLRSFLERLPAPEVLQEKLERNAAEAKLLKRVLRLSIEKQKANGEASRA
jgi:hypothetical protein